MASVLCKIQEMRRREQHFHATKVRLSVDAGFNLLQEMIDMGCFGNNSASALATVVAQNEDQLIEFFENKDLFGLQIEIFKDISIL